MKQALKRGPSRLLAAKAGVVALLLLAIVSAIAGLVPLWTVISVAVLAVLAFIVIWVFRSELMSTRQRLYSRERLLRKLASRARRRYNHDEITGLPNRTRLRNHLARRLTESRKKSEHLAVGILILHNLDTLRAIIDDDAGDDLLRQFADILNDEMPFYLAYVGPGLFAFLLEDIYDRETAFALMHEIIKNVSRNLTVSELPIRIQVSGGLAISPWDADTATALIQKAKLATINAGNSSAQLLLFNESMAPDLQKLKLISDLKNTLAAHELKWALQPQYDVRSKIVTGAELLVRWLHPTHGWVPPADFVVWAEQTGNVQQITEAAIEQACLILRQIKSRGLNFQLSVNLSSNDLSEDAMVKNIIDLTKGCADLLTLEITETALMQDMDAVIRNVVLLRVAGIKLSLDDYGTGYSSLQYLQTFKVDEIKIDKMFIQELAYNERNRRLVQASIELGHSLGATMVAEGVEDRESADLLIAMGCDVLQGYHIGRPVVVTDLDAYLKSLTLIPNNGQPH